ncbi:MAG TPA: hypothetical protein VH280_17110 [Verrucomicrobiae bacterium]|jgi:fatty acid desaturase|nr:hypothetical protein [Verrucomicrobiae bacterium]
MIYRSAVKKLATSRRHPGICLALMRETLTIAAMKFALAILVYLIMAAILGAGILLVVLGKPIFLIVVFIAYVVAFGKLGCMTH